MPYPSGHRERTKARIVCSARTLFNRHGFNEVSIDDVMAHAGLTRGVFYRYFDAKSDLYAQAIAQAMIDTPVSRWPELKVDFASVEAAQQVIRAYLSEQHFEDIDGSCPLVALPSDVSREDKVVKRTFQKVFEAMVELFERSQQTTGAEAHNRALAIAGLCVGGMVVARSLDSRDLADALRDAARSTALDLGEWLKSRPKTTRRARARS